MWKLDGGVLEAENDGMDRVVAVCRGSTIMSQMSMMHRRVGGRLRGNDEAAGTGGRTWR